MAKSSFKLGEMSSQNIAGGGAHIGIRSGDRDGCDG